MNAWTTSIATTVGAPPPPAVVVRHAHRHVTSTTTPRARIGAIAAAIAVVICGVTLAAHFLLGYGSSVVLSGSMRPHIRPGDLLITRVEPLSDVTVHSVIVYTPPGDSAPIAHRVVSITGTTQHLVITTRGDANPTADQPMSPSRSTIPIVIGVLPRVGFVLNAIDPRRPLPRAALVVLIGLTATVIRVRRTTSGSCRCTRCMRMSARHRHAVS